MVNSLLQLKANPCMMVKNGENLLHIAARQKSPEIASLLIEAKAIFSGELAQPTPLQIAVENQDAHFLQVLLPSITHIPPRNLREAKLESEI